MIWFDLVYGGAAFLGFVLGSVAASAVFRKRN